MQISEPLLRQPIRPEKPRLIKLDGGEWTCAGKSGTFGSGATPEVAYRAWRLHAILRGAEVFRNLRPFA